MSLAEEMLATMSLEDDATTYLSNEDEEEHIVINESRTAIVPNSLKTIAVAGDKDIETVTFDCVRYWDGNDLSTFAIYLNYVLPDLSVGTYIPESIVADGDVFHFDWKIKNNITAKNGKISFAITAIKTKQNESGETVVDKQWSSLPNSDCSIALGLGVSNVPSEEESSDVLAQMSAILEKIQEDFDEWLKNELLITQTTGNSETAIMSQKAVTAIATAQKNIEAKYGSASDDVFPLSIESWKQGAPGYNYNNRIYTSEFINVDGCERITVKVNPNSNIVPYFDAYTGNEADGYERKAGYGYYEADNYFKIKDFGYTAIRVTLKKKDNSNFTAFDVAEELKNIQAIKTYETIIEEAEYAPVKLRFMQYNIGKFNYGVSGGLKADVVDEKIANYKKFLGEYQPNIVCMQEYPVEEPGDGGEGWIDANHTYNPDETLFNALYPYSTEMYFEVAIKGDINPITTTNVNINISDASHRTKGTINSYKINGKTVGVLSCWFNVSAPSENRLNQLRDAIAQLAPFDIAIICADTNANNQDEFETMLGIIGDAGYIAANGGYFGSFETYNLNSSSYKQIDNIFVRGARIKNAICPDVYDELSSDHYPVIADIMIN